MFGFRPDGRRVDQDDPIIGLTPYLMPQRVDAQVHTMLRIDNDVLTRYIKEQRDRGVTLSYMSLVAAAYVRAMSQHPQVNRFIANKQVFARNSICISFAVLKMFEGSDAIKETTIKLHFSPHATLYDVNAALQDAISINRKPEATNDTDKVASFLLRIPGLPTLVVQGARLLDRYGLLPRYIVNASPFHTGMFLVNMASLGMPYVNHHIYNFGTTSLFLSMGKVEREPVLRPDGTMAYKRILPIGVVSDERVTSGAEYARAFTLWRDLLADPVQLETPPETVNLDFPPEKMPSLERRRDRRRKKKLAKRELLQ